MWQDSQNIYELSWALSALIHSDDIKILSFLFPPFTIPHMWRNCQHIRIIIVVISTQRTLSYTMSCWPLLHFISLGCHIENDSIASSLLHNTKKNCFVFFRAHNSDNTQFIHQRLIAVDLEFITFHPNPRKKSKRERELEWMNKICFFSVCMSSIRALLCISKWPRTTEKTL